MSRQIQSIENHRIMSCQSGVMIFEDIVWVCGSCLRSARFIIDLMTARQAL